MSILTDLHPEHRQYIAVGRAGKAGGQVRSVRVPSKVVADDVVNGIKGLAGVSNVITRPDAYGSQYLVEWLE